MHALVLHHNIIWYSVWSAHPPCCHEPCGVRGTDSALLLRWPADESQLWGLRPMPACMHAPTVTAPCSVLSRLTASHACMRACCGSGDQGWDHLRYRLQHHHLRVQCNHGEVPALLKQPLSIHPPYLSCHSAKAATHHRNRTSKHGSSLPAPNPPCRLLFPGSRKAYCNNSYHNPGCSTRVCRFLCPWSSLPVCPLPVTRGPPSAATPSACTYVPMGGGRRTQVQPHPPCLAHFPLPWGLPAPSSGSYTLSL